MALTVAEIINELEKYEENKLVRVLYGMPTPILWVSHKDKMFFEDEEGCTLYTSDDVEIDTIDRIDTVHDLLWHLQFFKKDAPVCNCDLGSCSSYIEEISDKVIDSEGNVIDIVFLINFAHIVG